MHLCGRIQWNIRWLQVSEGTRTGITYRVFFFIYIYICCCSFETGNSNSVLFLQWQLPLLPTMKWYICYPRVNGSQRSGLGGTQEWPWSLSSPGRQRRMLTYFFSFFFSYGVVRNTLNKYWWHFSFCLNEDLWAPGNWLRGSYKSMWFWKSCVGIPQNEHPQTLPKYQPYLWASLGLQRSSVT